MNMDALIDILIEVPKSKVGTLHFTGKSRICSEQCRTHTDCPDGERCVQKKKCEYIKACRKDICHLTCEPIPKGNCDL